MQKLRRTLCAALSAAMVFSLASPAFASDLEEETEKPEAYVEEAWEENEGEQLPEVPESDSEELTPAFGAAAYSLMPYGQEEEEEQQETQKDEIWVDSTTVAGSAVLSAVKEKHPISSRSSNVGIIKEGKEEVQSLGGNVTVEDGASYSVVTRSNSSAAWSEPVYAFVCRVKTPVTIGVKESATIAYDSVNKPGVEAVKAAVLDAETTSEVISADKITVEYKSSWGWYKLTDAVVQSNLTKGLTVRLTYTGGSINGVAYSKAVSDEATVTFRETSETTTIGINKDPVIEYFASVAAPTPAQVKTALFNQETTTPAALSENALELQYYSEGLLGFGAGWYPVDQNSINSGLKNGLKVRLTYAGGLIDEVPYSKAVSDEATVTFRDISLDSELVMKEAPTVIFYTGMEALPTAEELFAAAFDGEASTPSGLAYGNSLLTFEYKKGSRWSAVTDTTLSGWKDASIQVRVSFKGGQVGEEIYSAASAEATISLVDSRSELSMTVKNAELEYSPYLETKPNEASILAAVYNGTVTDQFSVEYSLDSETWHAYSDKLWQNRTVFVRVQFAGGVYGEVNYRPTTSEAVVLTVRDPRAALTMTAKEESFRIYYIQDHGATDREIIELVLDSIRPAVWDENTSQEVMDAFVQPTTFTVTYRSGDKYIPLDQNFLQPGELMDVRVRFEGDAVYQPAELDTTVLIRTGKSTFIMVQNGTVNYYTGMETKPTAADVFNAVYVPGESSNPGDLTADDPNVKVQYYSSLSRRWNAMEGNVSDLLLLAGKTDVRLVFTGTEELASYTTKSVTVTFADLRQQGMLEQEGEHQMGFRFGTDAPDAQEILKAMVTAQEGFDLTNEKITVKYYSALGYVDLTYVPGTALGHSFGAQETESIQIHYPGDEIYKAQTITASLKLVDPRIRASIVFNEKVSITYNPNPRVMMQELFEKAIDWENEGTVLPEKYTLTIDDFDMTYSAKLLEMEMPVQVPVVGSDTAPAMSAGSNKVKISYKGNAYYTATAADGSLDITVKKASHSLKVNSTSIYGGEAVPAGFITSSSGLSSRELGVVTLYTGVTNNVALGVYADIPMNFDPDSGFVKLLNPIVKAVIGSDIDTVLRDGITLGQLRKLASTEELMKVLELLGYDTALPKMILGVLDSAAELTDNIRIGVGTPNRVGVYSAAAVSTNPNFTAAAAVGTLVVKVQTKGVKLLWNEELPYVVKASEMDSGVFKAQLTYNGDPSISQSSVKYRYTGLTSELRIYSSTKAPTTPGTYVVTAYSQGGNYTCMPISRTFRIVRG